MDDLNAKIAARRQELARQQEQQKVAADKATQQRKVDEEAERRRVVDEIAEQLRGEGHAVVADAGELSLTPPQASFDTEGMKRAAIDRLVNREARRRWTPRENWIVIGCIAGGVCLLHIAGIGLIPIAIGVLVRSSTNKQHRQEVRAELGLPTKS